MAVLKVNIIWWCFTELDLILLLFIVGDAVGKQHENAQKLFGSFRCAECRHGWRDHRVYSARFPRLFEVRRSDGIEYNVKSSHWRHVSVTYSYLYLTYDFSTWQAWLLDLFIWITWLLPKSKYVFLTFTYW